MIMFCVSRLGNDERKKLANQCKTIDAKYSTIWKSECTHLVVSEKDFTVTEKLALALILCIPVVTLPFIEQLEKLLTGTNREGNITLPDPNDYVPSAENIGWKDIGLKSSPDLKVDPRRKNLFKNHHFITLNEKVVCNSSNTSY